MKMRETTGVAQC